MSPSCPCNSPSFPWHFSVCSLNFPYLSPLLPIVSLHILSCPLISSFISLYCPSFLFTPPAFLSPFPFISLSVPLSFPLISCYFHFLSPACPCISPSCPLHVPISPSFPVSPPGVLSFWCRARLHFPVRFCSSAHTPCTSPSFPIHFPSALASPSLPSSPSCQWLRQKVFATFSQKGGQTTECF